MIENCFNDETNFFEIKVDKKPESSEDINKLNLIAENISKETGVPKNLIYKAPYLSFIDNWYKIDNQWYFYKSRGYDAFYFINELIGEIISEYFGLATVHYNVAKLCVNGEDKSYGVLSKNFCNPENIYKRSWDYGFIPTRDLSVLQKIKDICQTKEQYLSLLNDMKKFFIRDFYTSQLDRSGNNFLFKIDENGIRLAPLYDYENSFESIFKFTYRNQIGELDITNPETQKILLADDKFQELLSLLMNINMSSFIELVEDKHKILVPNDIKNCYLKEDSIKKEMVLERKIIRK